MSSSSVATPAASRRLVWRWLAALAIVAAVGLNYYANVFPFNGQTMGAFSAKYPTLLTPAAYAFSIWGLIFLGELGYAVWQLLPGQRQSPLPGSLARPLILVNIATAAWVVLFAYELLWLCLGVILLLLGTLVTTYGRARRGAQAGEGPAWLSWLFSLYLGWVSVATTINFTIALQQLGWQPGAGLALVLALVLLGLIVALALVLSRAHGEFAFSLAVAWALGALWLARVNEVPELGWFALAGAVVALVGGVVQARLSKRKEPWEVAAEAAAEAEAELAAHMGARQPQ